MPSFVSTVLRSQLRFLKPIVSKAGIEVWRAAQDKIGELGMRAMADKITIETVMADGFDMRMVIPQDTQGQDGRVILYLHGGAYVAGHIQYALGFGSELAVHTGRHVLCVAYRLAPEYPFPAALEDAYSAYRYLLGQRYRPRDIAFVGESAGGGLSYCLALLLKQKGMPLPGAMVGISPWTDLTFGGASYTTNEKADPSLSEETLRCHAESYAPSQAFNPLVSPIFGDLRGFPPSLLFAGSDELLLSDVTELAELLRRKDNACECIVEKGMWHVYVLFNLPESQAAMAKIKAFLELHHDEKATPE